MNVNGTRLQLSAMEVIPYAAHRALIYLPLCLDLFDLLLHEDLSADERLCVELLRKHSVRRLFEKLTTELGDGLACSSDKQPSLAVGKERVGGTIKDESRSLLLERAEDGVGG